MKTLIGLLALGFGVALATPTYFNRTSERAPEVVQTESFSVLMLDALLNPGDTAYSRPVDLLRVPINYRDTGVGDAALLPDYTMGEGMLTCYDAADSAVVTDSVDVTGQVYKAQYAGDNADPQKSGESGGKSDAWATLGSAYAIDAASASSAILEATAAITLASNLDRFVRFRLINNNTTAKDKSRCRFYWVKKALKH
jgi:hypothetical protein